MLGTIRCALESTAKKVKALLSVKEQVILVANDLPEARTPFAKGHELGHSTLAWHRQILYVCDEHDLNWATREQMEWEANLFSAEVLLPGSLVDSVYEAYPTSMETVLLLHEWSGASIETCAIKYVGRHPDECALLVLDDDCDQNTIAGLKLTRKILSQRGVSRFGMLTKAQRFDSQHSQPPLQNFGGKITKQKTRCSGIAFRLQNGTAFVKSREVSGKFIEIIAEIVRPVLLGDGFEDEPKIQQMLREREFLREAQVQLA